MLNARERWRNCGEDVSTCRARQQDTHERKDVYSLLRAASNTNHLADGTPVTRMQTHKQSDVQVCITSHTNSVLGSPYSPE